MQRLTRLAVLALALAAMATFGSTVTVQAAPPAGGGGGGGAKGNLAGVVVTDSGEPVPGATVLLFSDQPGAIDQVAEDITDGDGEFLFKKLPAGDYSITVLVLTIGGPLDGCGGSGSATVVKRETTEVTIVVDCP